MIEWKAHNDINSIYKNERCMHVDFDFNDRNVSYMGFWARAFTEGVQQYAFWK